MDCYYKEMFILGLIIAIFIFEGIMLYGDIIIGWFKRVINVLN